MVHQHDAVLGLAAVILTVSGAGFLAGAWDARRQVMAAGRWRSVVHPIVDPALGRMRATDIAAAALLLAAATIHIAAAGTHRAESLLFALAFAATAGIQIASGAGILLRKPVAYRVALRTSMIVVGGWAMSRFIGLPAGPHPWIPEPIGMADGMATAFEVMVIALLRGATRPASDSSGPRRPVVVRDLASIGIVPFVGIVGLLAAIVVVSSGADGGSHHHDDSASGLGQRAVPRESWTRRSSAI